MCSILFQLYWFGLVWSAGINLSLILAVICVLLSLGQLYLYAKPFGKSLKYVCIATLAGVIMDSVLTFAGVISPLRIMVPWPIPPAWLIGLWFAFITYTRTGLDGMRGSYLLLAAAGFIFGPLAWMGGGRMDAGEVNSNLLAGYGVLAVCWAVFCVLTFKLSDIIRDE